MSEDEAQLRRARITEAALMAASQKVIKTLTDASMNACFPLIADDHSELMKELKKLCEDKYNEGIPTAWKDMTTSFNFIDNANELDKVLFKAQRSKEAGQPPRNMYELGSDAHVTIPNAAVPVLRAATADLRAKREQLQRLNEERLAKVQASHAEAERTTDQVKQIIADFQEAVALLRKQDPSKLEAIQEKLLQQVPDRGEATK